MGETIGSIFPAITTLWVDSTGLLLRIERRQTE